MMYPESWRRKADARFSAAINARGFCERCGSTETLTCAHLERRRYYPTRWDPAAALCLCLPCHTWLDSERTAAEEWLETTIGAEARAAIRAKARGTEYPSRADVLAGIAAVES